MTEHMNKFEDTKRGPLDDPIDAALAKYAAVEPRPGLEERILANLKAQDRSSSGMAWWHWAGVVAAAIVLATLLVWRLEKPQRRIVQQTPNSRQEMQPKVAVNTPQAKSDRPIKRASSRPPRRHAAAALVVATSEPKLDRFPSPQPLSEEELALARYVSQFPREATLIARAQEDYEKEIQRQMNDERSDTDFSDYDLKER